jgi:carbamoyltransferase
MYILGISAYYHDAAAAIIKDGEIIAAAQEERFTRIKHDENFPLQAIKYCLKEAAIEIEEVGAVVFYDKPFLKFERILETFVAYAPKGLLQFVKAIPVWIKEKFFLKKKIKEQLSKLGNFNAVKQQLLFTPHHLSHAASAYFASPYSESAVLTIDGVGEWATTSLCKANGNSITVLQEINFPHSVGLLYSSFTYFLGFKVNSGEYKLMGLAPYGNEAAEETTSFKKIITDKLCTVYNDGSLLLHQPYFNYTTGLTMINDKQWQQLFHIPRRNAADEITQQHCNLALAIQQVTEDIVIKMAYTAKMLTGSNNLCMAGGVALNCVANGKLQQLKIFKNIYIQPAAGDAGGALGAALAAHYIFFNQPQKKRATVDAMQGAYLGPAFSQLEIEYTCKKNKLVYTICSDETLFDVTAGHLASNKVIGWFNGRMEFGPRALGNRSILASPLDSAMQQQLNLKIKFREGFRPFAPAVLADKASAFFEIEQPSPYMLMVYPVKNKTVLPAGFSALSISEKLNFRKSNLPAITHADGSARVQTVDEKNNPLFYKLLNAFYEKTGCPVLINTSFNVRGEPIVCTPQEAIDCFLHTEMDVLVLQNIVLQKQEQIIALPTQKRKFTDD